MTQSNSKCALSDGQPVHAIAAKGHHKWRSTTRQNHKQMFVKFFMMPNGNISETLFERTEVARKKDLPTR
jgi:hypothetical protein